MQSTALIILIVELLLRRSVSWVREKDSHILAVDGEVFIQDQRFTSLAKENNQWTLMVSSTRLANNKTVPMVTSMR
jgi:hypothetical protein